MKGLHGPEEEGDDGPRSHCFDRFSFGYDRHRGVNKVTAMSKPLPPRWSSAQRLYRDTRAVAQQYRLG
jgi:hypothetical protein